MLNELYMRYKVVKFTCNVSTRISSKKKETRRINTNELCSMFIYSYIVSFFASMYFKISFDINIYFEIYIL